MMVVNNMWQILLAVALGFLVGHFKLVPANSKLTNGIMTFGLIFLLLTMGAQLGANKELIADFSRLGLQATALAAGGVICSVLLVRLVEGYLRRKLTENHQQETEVRIND